MAYKLIHGRKGTDGEHRKGAASICWRFCWTFSKVLYPFFIQNITKRNTLFIMLNRWYQWLVSAKLQWHDLFIYAEAQRPRWPSTHPFTWFFRLSDSQLPGEIHRHDVRSRWSLMNFMKRNFWSDDQNIAICHWLILFIFYDNKASKHCDHAEGASTRQVVGHYANSYSTHSILLIIYNILYFFKILSFIKTKLHK
jgi:hypothetical protein